MRRIKENIIYGLKSIKKRKTQSLFLLVQISCSILLMCYVLTNYYDSRNVVNSINKYMGRENIYSFYNLDTYNLAEEEDEKTVLEKYRKVFSKIKESDVEKILVSNTESFGGEEDEGEFNTLQISPNFFKKYEIKISKKIESTEKVFKLRQGEIYNQKKVPVYIGSELGGKYGLNEIIKIDSNLSFKVVGLLKEKQSISLPMQGKESTSVDDMILIPFYLDLKENFIQYLESLQFIANEKAELKEIIDILNKEKIADYYFKNYKDQLVYIQNDYINLYVVFLSIGVVFAAFSIISIIGMIMQIIKDSEYEYGVSMMCGARRVDIFIRLVTQIIFVFVVGTFLLYGFFGITKASNSILCGVLLMISLVLIYGWNKINIGEIINKIKKE